jgi:hypothetical protein
MVVEHEARTAAKTTMSTGTDNPTTFGNTMGGGITLSPFGFTFEKYQAKDFTRWQFAQAKLLRAKGESEDLVKEKSYIEHMMKNVLRAYVCHREVDDYADCLVKKKIVEESELHRASVNMQMAETYCKREVTRYQGCMGKKQHYDTIVEAATGHANCDDLRVDLQVCLERHDETDAQEKSCMRQYYGLMRCGLNCMFDDYWRKVSSFGTLEEMHLFEVEQDYTKQAAVRQMKTRYGT